MDQSRRDLVPIIIGPTLLFLVFVGVLWAAGFLTFTGSDPSSKVVAAALALVGAFLGSVVSVVGVLRSSSWTEPSVRRMTSCGPMRSRSWFATPSASWWRRTPARFRVASSKATPRLVRLPRTGYRCSSGSSGR